MFDHALSTRIDYALYQMEQSRGIRRRFWRLWLRYLESRMRL